MKVGVDVNALERVVSTGSGQSFGWDKFAPLVLDRQFSTPEFGYPMASAFKDMEVVSKLMRDNDVQLPVVQATTETYKTELDMGCGQENKGAMVKVVEERIGVVTVPYPGSRL